MVSIDDTWSSLLGHTYLHFSSIENVQIGSNMTLEVIRQNTCDKFSSSLYARDTITKVEYSVKAFWFSEKSTHKQKWHIRAKAAKWRRRKCATRNIETAEGIFFLFPVGTQLSCTCAKPSSGVRRHSMAVESEYLHEEDAFPALPQSKADLKAHCDPSKKEGSILEANSTLKVFEFWHRHASQRRGLHHQKDRSSDLCTVDVNLAEEIEVPQDVDLTVNSFPLYSHLKNKLREVNLVQNAATPPKEVSTRRAKARERKNRGRKAQRQRRRELKRVATEVSAETADPAALRNLQSQSVQPRGSAKYSREHSDAPFETDEQPDLGSWPACSLDSIEEEYLWYCRAYFHSWQAQFPSSRGHPSNFALDPKAAAWVPEIHCSAS